MTYLKSTLSGQCYAMPYLPKFLNGYEIIHRDEFVQWCKENNFTTKEMGDVE